MTSKCLIILGKIATQYFHQIPLLESSGFADSNDRKVLGVSLIMHNLQSEEVWFPMPCMATAF